jgi:hypothetical protein
VGRHRRIRVRKYGGQVEDFNADKLRRSLMRAGARTVAADQIIDEILDEVADETSTKQVYRLAHSRLKKTSRACGLRYTLKKALFRLGPTGYPFEQYVGDVLKNHGYKTKVGITLEGKCVSHEIDVLAVSDSEVSVMECKYHNRKGTTTDVKVALYVHSRVRDLEPTITGRYGGKKYSGWLVTNTRCTADALAYARCAGLKVLSWRHPEGRGLETMIEEKKLYPVTMVYGIQAGLVEKLISERILLLKDLLAMSLDTLQSRLGLTPQKAATLRKKAEDLCG